MISMGRNILAFPLGPPLGPPWAPPEQLSRHATSFIQIPINSTEQKPIRAAKSWLDIISEMWIEKLVLF